ncbi:MAG TPA: haloalkane dehalogenase [Trebonia sp.]|nr:haloalkane dehalogenase [Trebonia sp.]
MRIDFTPDPSLYPFTSHWFDSPAGRLHYVDEGAGPPILFLHGNPTWSFLYRKVIIALRERFRCVAVDYLGFGLSERPVAYGYTAEEHARCVGELVDHLQLDGFITMGHDWGGPVGMAVATARAERVRGVILGDTWFWPADLRMTAFSRVMSTAWMRRQMLEHNTFVERVIPLGTARRLTPAEMNHYRQVQPSPAARNGVAELPRELLAAGPLLRRLAREVPATLGAKPALLVWGRNDLAFRPAHLLPRMRGAFADNVTVVLPHARHFIQEDAPQEIAEAITKRFG